MTEVGTALNSPAPWCALVLSFLQLNLILPQTMCSCAVQKMWLKSFLLEYYPPSLSLACQKFMGIIPTLLLIPSVFSVSVQLSPTAFPSWWNPMAILVLRASSSATFSAEGNPLNIPGEAQCIPPHSYKNLLVVHLRKGGVSVSWKQFRDMHLLTVIWQWSEDLWD